MEPLTAVIMGIAFFNESLNFSHYSGIALVFVAVILVITSKRTSD